MPSKLIATLELHYPMIQFLFLLIIQAQITFLPRRLWNITWYIKRRLWNRKSSGKTCRRHKPTAVHSTDLTLLTLIQTPLYTCVCFASRIFFFYVLMSCHVSPYPSLQEEPLLLGVPEFWQLFMIHCRSQGQWLFSPSCELQCHIDGCGNSKLTKSWLVASNMWNPNV